MVGPLTTLPPTANGNGHRLPPKEEAVEVIHLTPWELRLISIEPAGAASDEITELAGGASDEITELAGAGAASADLAGGASDDLSEPDSAQKGILLITGDTLIDALEASFARALVRFYPFAGRLAAERGHGTITVSLRCTGEGFDFVRAVSTEVAANDKVSSLYTQPVVWSFYSFNQVLGADAASDDLPLVPVQVTELADGMTLNHSVGISLEVCMEPDALARLVAEEEFMNAVSSPAGDGVTTAVLANTTARTDRSGGVVTDDNLRGELATQPPRFAVDTCLLPCPMPFAKRFDPTFSVASSDSKLEVRENNEMARTATVTFSSLQAHNGGLYTADTTIDVYDDSMAAGPEEEGGGSFSKFDIAVPSAADQVFRGAGTLAQQQKRYTNYSRKAISFVMTMSAAYKVSASASLSIGKVAFMIAIAAMTIADIVFSAKVKLAPKWSVYLSVPWSIYLCGSLLVLASYLLLISFHTDYVYSIFPVLFLIVAAFLHHKYKEKVNKDIPRGKENDDKTGKDDNSDDEEVEHFDGIFETSSNIVTGGSLITLFGGQYMVGVVSPLGFFFFFTVVLGIYLMTITTVRTGALTPHATYLEIMLKLQLVITIITAFFP